MTSILDLCRNLPERCFDTGDFILREGGNDRVLFVLEAGSVEILKEEVQINTVSTPGAILGEVSVLLDRPTMASVRALEPSTFRVAEEPEAFLQANSEINLQIARMLAGRLNGVTAYLVDLKRQFEANQDHLGIVDEVLESLLHHQGKKRA